MIVDALVTVILGLISAIFELLPDIPPLGSQFNEIMLFTENTIITSITFIQYLVTAEYLALVAGLVVVLVLFTPAYHMSMFIYNKIRGA